MSDRVEQLESEIHELRSKYQTLDHQYAQLQTDLGVANERVAELEGQDDEFGRGNGLGSDEERLYVASKKRRKFHRPSCEFAPCIIDSPNLIEFGSHREAREAGYKPCGRCSA